MHYNIINMADDPRSGQFAYFRGMTFPFAGLTVEMDITDMMAARGERPFFLSMLYAVVRAANAVPQLRRRLAEDGTVVEYDWCSPSYTAMKPDGVYVYCTVEGDMPYGTFIAEGQRRQREVLERGTRAVGTLLAAAAPGGEPGRQQSPHQLGQICDRQRADDTAGVAVREPRPGGRAAYLPVLPEPGERTGGYDPPMEREQIRFLLYIVKETNDYEPSLSRPERAAGNVPEVL